MIHKNYTIARIAIRRFRWLTQLNLRLLLSIRLDQLFFRRTFRDEKSFLDWLAADAKRGVLDSVPRELFMYTSSDSSRDVLFRAEREMKRRYLNRLRDILFVTRLRNVNKILPSHYADLHCCFAASAALTHSYLLLETVRFPPFDHRSTMYELIIFIITSSSTSNNSRLG